VGACSGASEYGPGWLGALPQPARGARGKAFVDWQNDVTAADLGLAVREGFRSIEHIKRYTTTGMATDQGKTSNLNVLAMVADLTNQPVPQVGHTTFRMPYTPVTFGALAGAARDNLFPPIFGQLSPQGVPATGIVISATLATVLVMAQVAGGSGFSTIYNLIVSLSTMAAVVPYAFCALGLEWKARGHERRNDKGQVAIFFRERVHAGEAPRAESLLNQRLAALVADKVRNYPAEGRAKRAHHRINQAALGLGGHIVGNHRIDGNTEKRRIDERDEAHGPDAAQRGEQGHDPGLVANQNSFEYFHESVARSTQSL
jgi:hypothetical protein